MPAVKPIEWNCEELIKLRMENDTRLDDYEIHHHDKTGPAEVNTIVLKALVGPKSLEGCKPNNVTVTATFTSASLTPEQSDKVSAAMRDSVYNPELDIDPSELPDFAFVSIEEDCSMDRQDGKKVRKRIITFPLLAKLIA